MGSNFDDFGRFLEALGSFWDRSRDFLPNFGASFCTVFLDPLLGPIFRDFGTQRPPKWRQFKGDLVDFLVIL